MKRLYEIRGPLSTPLRNLFLSSIIHSKIGMSGSQGFKQMTLGEYLLQLKGDLSYEKIGEDVGMSPATIYKIVVGKTTQPTPDVLDKLAVYFGASDPEQRAIYAEMMRLAGYLERMPERLRPTLKDALRATDAAAEQFGLDDPANHGHPLDKKQQNSHS